MTSVFRRAPSLVEVAQCRGFASFSLDNVKMLVEGTTPPTWSDTPRPSGPKKEAVRQLEPKDLRDSIAFARSICAEGKARGGSFAKINDGLDFGLKLGVDPKRGDHNVRGVVVLPHGTGRNVFVAVFSSSPDDLVTAREAGADLIGGEELISRIVEEPEAAVAPIQACIASPDMASKLARVARILGPRGLMPNAKAGTLTHDIGKAIREVKRGRVEFRLDRSGWIRKGLGKTAQFSEDQLLENVVAFSAAIANAKPEVFQASLSRYLTDAFVKTTTGPRVPIRVESLLEELRSRKLVMQ